MFHLVGKELSALHGLCRTTYILDTRALNLEAHKAAVNERIVSVLAKAINIPTPNLQGLEKGIRNSSKTKPRAMADFLRLIPRLSKRPGQFTESRSYMLKKCCMWYFGCLLAGRILGLGLGPHGRLISERSSPFANIKGLLVWERS